MLDSSWLWFTLVQLMLILTNGKFDNRLVDKHQEDHTKTASSNIRIPEDIKKSDAHEDVFGAKMYRSLFSVKHREQLNAVKSLLAMKSKREKFLLELVHSIIKVIVNGKRIIEKAEFSPNDTFPTEGKKDLRDAIGNVVENTVFYSTLLLHFPTVLLSTFKKDTDWQLVFAWAYKFTLAVRLHDDAADKLLDLAGQQLDIIPKRNDFYNPYDKKAIKDQMERKALQKMEEALHKKREQKKVERKKIKIKKPSLSRIEL
ncbi:unnamed protein product [Thelazia callipaeda]|uniref:Coiled-coil domain-containing protein 134 n=1 Tax=Thelazia callipaeda TaxID=103827 RepID=A0A0N5CYM1_THECL|nr:unnamed protein product [Thelazia callipaeda]